MKWRVKTKHVLLPCGHTQRRLSNMETDQLRVRKGDIGICLECGEWWECIGLPHERIRYIPSPSDIERLKRLLAKLVNQ